MAAFNLEGNFDSIMGFMGCIVGLIETHNQYKKTIIEDSKIVDDITKFISANKFVFPNARITSDNFL